MITLDLSILNQKGTPMFYSDLTANIPAAGIAGRIFIATDSPYGIFRDTGSTWDQVAGSGGGGGGNTIYTANDTLTSNRTVSSGGFSLTFNPSTTFATTLSAPTGSGAVSVIGVNTLSYSAGFSSSNLGSVYGAIGGINFQTFAGSATFANANLAAANVSVNSVNFSSAGSTITMTQATGLRVMAGHQSQFQYQGTNSGTITHAAISQNLGFYRPPSAAGILTITNAYGHLINDLNDYGAGFTFTNRWGIYQSGASDRNYFAGNILVGSTIDTGQKAQITGNSIFNGDIFSNANSTSGTLKLNSGDTNSGASGYAQIALSFQGTRQYNAFIVTNHGSSGQNTIKFYTCNGIANNTLSNSVLGLTILDGNGYFESILSAKNEIRLFETFRRIAVPLSTGSYAGGFNVKIVSDVLQLDTGPISGAAGYSYGQDGSTNFFNLPVSSIGTPLIQTFKIFNSGNVQVQNGGTFTDIGSAIMQINSVTKGFLKPRMTNAQILAIVSPANGLETYNTDLNTPCFYDGTGWRKVSHSAM